MSCLQASLLGAGGKISPSENNKKARQKMNLFFHEC